MKKNYYTERICEAIKVLKIIERFFSEPKQNDKKKKGLHMFFSESLYIKF